MKFEETPLSGAYLIDLQPVEDGRGFFARSFCGRELEQLTLKSTIVQCNVSFNFSAATLRGLHYQVEPHREVKIVRCTAGSIFDAIIDLRPGSKTYRRWFGVELSARNRRALYVPEGFAHGYLTLADNSEVQYMVSEFYSPGHERGIRWNDRAFGIAWPLTPKIMSDKDANHPDFQ
jgi:dTDP-4-dehydrorhamnose 3,5-epimerase